MAFLGVLLHALLTRFRWYRRSCGGVWELWRIAGSGPCWVQRTGTYEEAGRPSWGRRRDAVEDYRRRVLMIEGTTDLVHVDRGSVELLVYFSDGTQRLLSWDDGSLHGLCNLHEELEVLLRVTYDPDLQDMVKSILSRVGSRIVSWEIEF